MSNATATWALRPDVVATVVEDGAVLLDLESKYFYSVNATGWAMLRLFEAGATREHAEERCKGWGAPDSDGDAIARFLDLLLEEHLVEANGAPPQTPEVAVQGGWSAPKIEKHKEPLQKIMTSAFDPSLPLAE
jgi:hypothetical protein